jgi:hypothetical protein
MTAVASAVLALSTVACSSGPSLQSRTVQLTKVESDVTECRALGEVAGSKGWGYGNGSAKEAMRNKAALLKADVVLYHGTLTGVAGEAYDCGGKYAGKGRAEE